MTYAGSVRFEWDPNKDRAHPQKHGLSFSEATKPFTGGTDYLEIYDEKHWDEEDCFIATGEIRLVVVVVFTEGQEDVVRIVSARPD